jgi:hypothetical protein
MIKIVKFFDDAVTRSYKTVLLDFAPCLSVLETSPFSFIWVRRTIRKTTYTGGSLGNPTLRPWPASLQKPSIKPVYNKDHLNHMVRMTG